MEHRGIEPLLPHCKCSVKTHRMPHVECLVDSLGFEPRLSVSETVLLPLEEGAMRLSKLTPRGVNRCKITLMLRLKLRSPRWIRTTIGRVRVCSPTVRRLGNVKVQHLLPRRWTAIRVGGLRLPGVNSAPAARSTVSIANAEHICLVARRRIELRLPR